MFTGRTPCPTPPQPPLQRSLDRLSLRSGQRFMIGNPSDPDCCLRSMASVVRDRASGTSWQRCRVALPRPPAGHPSGHAAGRRFEGLRQCTLDGHAQTEVIHERVPEPILTARPDRHKHSEEAFRLVSKGSPLCGGSGWREDSVAGAVWPDHWPAGFGWRRI